MRCAFAAILILFCVGVPALAVNIETVPVGDAGNPGDVQPQGTFGAVAYNYRIGTKEVTVGQYTEFLNAVAATDTYGLYNTFLATTESTAGIARDGDSGSYTYSVIGSANHPVTYVSWGDAARFANWLHNGQPTGAQGPGTTETGAYTLNGASNDGALNEAARNPGATWFLPSEDEWFKAAYYQPASKGGDSDNNWAYPMMTNIPPYSDQPPGATPDNTRVGNFFSDDGVDNGYNDGYGATGSTNRYTSHENFLTDVGAYISSPSYYGTFDQGGNVWEWNEALYHLVNRGLRGGAWTDSSLNLLAAVVKDDQRPTHGTGIVGFRVATVPEPSTVILATFGLAALAAYGWRRKSGVGMG